MSARKSATLKRSRRAAEAAVALLRSPRGQAMVEYSVVTHFLLLGSTIALMPMIAKLFEAFSKFYESIFFVLNSGAI